MKKEKQQKAELSEYFLIKRSIELPLKLKLYFNVLQATISQNNQVIQSKDESKAFVIAFTKFSIEQKSHFICENIKFVANSIFEKNNEENMKKILNNSNSDIKNIETTASMSSSKLKIPYWTEVHFKFDKIRREIYFTQNKKSTVIDLKNYLARKSKKYKGAIVLDLAIQQAHNKKQKYLFSFESDIGNSIYQQIMQVVISCKNQILFGMLTNRNQKQEQVMRQIGPDNKALVFLNSKNINNYLNSKEKYLKYLLTAKFDFKTIYQTEKSSPFKIEHSQKNQKIFKMECIRQTSVRQLKKQFLQCYQDKNAFISSSQILETFAKQKYKAIYEKYAISGRSQQLIYIKEQIYPQSKQQTEQIFLFMKSIENIMIRNFMDYFIVKARPINSSQSKLLVICSINLTPLITVQIIKQFLKQMGTMLDRKQTVQQMKTIKLQKQQSMMFDEFHTVNGCMFPQQQNVEFIEADDQFKGQFQIEQFSKSKPRFFQITKGSKKIKYRLQPLPVDTYNPKNNLMTEHYLFKQWVRYKEGGVMCINDAIINEQKKMFKHVITTFGNQILKGGSILNISLPVTVFKKQSHLSSIARDFCFAPLFFENLTDRLERVKMAVLLGISVGTLGISMDKPFNPILGQTLQAWIGGCPMYLEQISHHPPIGSYLFYGRGYRIYGQIQPRITFGMNNVKGYSDNPNFIQFQDGTLIQMVYGRMRINGLLFGQRTFDFDDNIYAYDKKNHIFAEVNYGPRKKNIIMKNIQPKDFVFGKIYKLRPEFLPKFNESMPRIYPTKQDILKDLSEFEGLWTGSMKFDNKQYIDFRTALPCKIQEEQHPLPSNCLFRVDYLRLLQDNIAEAQKQKQLLEQFQRRDRMLRLNRLKQTQEFEK